jgi:hypothetical protein
MRSDIRLEDAGFVVVVTLFDEPEQAHRAELGLRASPQVAAALAENKSAVRTVGRVVYVGNSRGRPVDVERFEEVVRLVGAVALPPLPRVPLLALLLTAVGGASIAASSVLPLDGSHFGIPGPGFGNNLLLHHGSIFGLFLLVAGYAVAEAAFDMARRRLPGGTPIQAVIGAAVVLFVVAAGFPDFRAVSGEYNYVAPLGVAFWVGGAGVALSYVGLLLLWGVEKLAVSGPSLGPRAAAQTYAASRAAVYDMTLRAVSEAGYSLVRADRASGVLTFSAKAAAPVGSSFGRRLTATVSAVSPDTSKTVVNVRYWSRDDWGRCNAFARAFLGRVARALIVTAVPGDDSQATHAQAREAEASAHVAVGELRQLAELRNAGALTDAEFTAAKAKLLA